MSRRQRQPELDGFSLKAQPDRAACLSAVCFLLARTGSPYYSKIALMPFALRSAASLKWFPGFNSQVTSRPRLL